MSTIPNIVDELWEILLPPQILHDDTARTRVTDLETSHEAADTNTNRAAVEAAVLELLAEYPSSDEELTTRYLLGDYPQAHIDSPRKRRSDLTKKGLVAPTGDHVTSPTGRRITVWGIA